MSSEFQKDVDCEARCRKSFSRQKFMKMLDAKLISVEPGQVTIELPFCSDFTQQHGFLHAGVVTSIVDNACGYAALSLMPPGAAVLSVEFKINFLKPAAGEIFRAVGKVVRAGNTLTTCTGEVSAHSGEKSALIAMMQATLMTVHDMGGLVD